MPERLLEALVYYDYDIDKADELRKEILFNYLTGLSKAGWEGNSEEIRISFDLVMALHWTFRLICRIQNSDDSNAIKRNSKVLQFVLDGVEKVVERIK